MIMVRALLAVMAGDDDRKWLRPRAMAQAPGHGAARRQFGHRQSCDASSGMGKWNGSAAHQQSPASLHLKTVPQRAQVKLRGQG
jgi:hypothetical protein